jgi:tetratricopeptide (TPR) repeat protein
MLIVAAIAVFIVQPLQTGQQTNLISGRDVARKLAPVDLDVISQKEQAFLTDLQAYAKASPTMGAQQSARQWLGLLDESSAVPVRPQRFDNLGMNSSSSLEPVLVVLPAPEVWPQIEAIIAARPMSLRTLDLQLLFARLNGNEAKVLDLSDKVGRAWSAASGTSDSPYPSIDDGIRSASLWRTGDLKSQTDQLEAQLAIPTRDHSVTVPNLVSLIGMSAAEAKIRSLRRLGATRIYATDPETKALARRLFIASLNPTTPPDWGLVDGVGDFDDVQKMVDCYGLDSLKSSTEGSSRVAENYFGGLLSRGEVDKACALLKSIGQVPSLYTFDYETLGAPLTQRRFFESVAQVHKRLPQQDLWELYVTSSELAGRADLVAKEISAIVHDPKTPQKNKERFFRYLTDLHGSLGDGASLARDLENIRDLPNDDSNVSSDEDSNLLELGIALHDQRLIDLGVATVGKGRDSGEGHIFDDLINQKRWAQAERFELAILNRGIRTGIPHEDEMAATKLCQIYYGTNRPNDILTLLKEFPRWSAEDLAGLGTVFGARDTQVPLTYYAAWAFAKTGQRDLAVRTLQQCALQTYGCEEVYVLLSELTGADSLPLYDELINGYPFASRPLMGKAGLLIKLGKFDEAEKYLRQAIALDPSDSQAPVGHRFKAYEMLAGVLSQKHDEAGAAFCKLKLKAVRVSEEADRLFGVGLLPQAAALYEQALAISATDFVTADRLGQCYARMGRTDLAVARYRTAYELMPQGFGPATDPPNECNELFFQTSLMDLGLAVLTRASQKPHAGASVSYVKGCIEEGKDNKAAAVKDFAKSTEEDPNFYNAWKKMSDNAETTLDPVTAEKVSYTMISLKPPAESLDARPELVRDLKTFYTVIMSRIKVVPHPSATSILHLHWVPSPPQFFGDYDFSPIPESPGMLLLRAEDIRQILRYYAPPTRG